mmetsp:Transcript_21657/g.53428  ORF Transcript_21657/g.53428 Transcript_21657/m.53428 type:complete len:533 (-) Transcript_21657:650-2248(-)
MQGCTRINNQGMLYFAQLGMLRRLDLAGCSKLGDGGLPHMYRSVNLEVLNLSETQVTAAGLANLLPHTPNIHTLILNRCTQLLPYDSGRASRTRTAVADRELLAAAMGMLPNLAVLSLVANASVDDLFIARVAAAVPGLVDLNVADCNSIGDASAAAIQELRALTRLSIRNTKITDHGLGIAALPESLVGLDISGCTSIGSSGLVGTLSRLAQLHSLDLSHNPNVDLCALTALACGTSSVVDLALEGCPHVDDDCILALAASQPHLAVLRVSYTAVTDAGLAALAAVPTLTTLSLRGLDVSAAGLHRLATLPALAFLNLSECRNINTDASAALARMPALVHLTVKECPSLSVSAVSHLVTASPRLEALNARGCPLVSEDAVEDLMCGDLRFRDRALRLRVLKFDTSQRRRADNCATDLWAVRSRVFLGLFASPGGVSGSGGGGGVGATPEDVLEGFEEMARSGGRCHCGPLGELAARDAKRGAAGEGAGESGAVYLAEDMGSVMWPRKEKEREKRRKRRKDKDRRMLMSLEN